MWRPGAFQETIGSSEANTLSQGSVLSPTVPATHGGVEGIEDDTPPQQGLKSMPVQLE